MIRDPVVLAFSTASSEAAYPRTFEALQRFGISRRIAGFVLPLGYSFNLDGSMMYCTFAVLFIAQVYGIELTIAQQVTMLLLLMVTSKGMAGVPRASLVVIAATLIARASQPDGDDPELRSIGLENRIDFTGTRDWPVHFGAQAEYKWGVIGADDEVELKLLLEHQSGPFSARLNLITSRDMTDDADWEQAYAARLWWRTNDAVSLGVEAYGELDADAHAAGPRATFGVGQATLGLSYLVGLDEAQADNQFRLTLEWAS
jgi:hypothetical protein